MPTITNQKKGLILITALLLVSAVIFFVSRRRSDAPEEHAGRIYVHVSSFSLPNGWGYDIMAGEKKYIHQAQIPAVAGRHPFLSEEDALKTGRLVVYKISHNLMPSVSVAELDSLGVSWKK